MILPQSARVSTAPSWQSVFQISEVKCAHDKYCISSTLSIESI